MTLFKIGQFTAASGKQLDWKVECDALTDMDWAWAADQIYRRAAPYSHCEGVPTGGLRLAEILNTYAHGDGTGPVLIVDDVLTTGGSMERQRAGRDAIGFVIFARGPLPSWVRALWTWDGDRK